MEFKEEGLDEYRINNHGIIGDTYSTALVTVKGTVDWCTFPRMDSPPVLSSILDREKGGEFRISLPGSKTYNQSYRKDTNILETTISSDRCTVKVTDFMPVERVRGLVYSRHEIHRLISCRKGHGRLELSLTPRFNFGRDRAVIGSRKRGCIIESSGDTLSVLSRFRWKAREDSAYCRFNIGEGDIVPVVLRWNGREPREPKIAWTNDLLRGTASFWRDWARKSQYTGDWKGEVIRSALVLKLLTYTPTGGIVAAATTSLPESIGHGRNWDYRYSWIRDSTYALWSFHLLGQTEEERKYLQWLLRLLKGRASKPEKLRVMYTVEGDAVPPETEISGYSGYLDSRPVREGNSATDQVQMDIYGSVIDAIHFTFHSPERLPDELWRVVDGLATYVKGNWKKPDAGIWEMRTEYMRHTHSAMMSWLALWRASEMAGWIGSGTRKQEWARIARNIRTEVMNRAYDQGLRAFSGVIGGGHLDASVLMMPLVRFINASDPRFSSTLKAIESKLLDRGFIYRYRLNDGLQGTEGAFVACTFWHTIALVLKGETEKATALFENMLRHANHLGLLPEEIDPSSGDFLGNFPQAFSHMGLINAAWNISAHRRRLFH